MGLMAGRGRCGDNDGHLHCAPLMVDFTRSLNWTD